MKQTFWIAICLFLFSCNQSRKITLSPNSGMTQVAFDDVKFQFFGDYRFKKRKSQLLPKYEKKIISNLGIKGEVYGIGSTNTKPYFSIMILKTDWQTIPDQNYFMLQVNQAGGGAVTFKEWAEYEGAANVEYKITQGAEDSYLFFNEHLFTYQESVYRMIFWTNDRPENLRRESAKIFRTISHP